jgi:hypothetical protein
MKEARAWIDERRGELDASQFIVLGVGGGFHIRCLRQTCPEAKIIVIEKEREISQAVSRAHHLHLSSVVFIQRETAEDVMASEILRAALRFSYRVLATPVSLQMDGDFYSTLRDLLLGRSPIGLRYLLKQRPQWATAFDFAGDESSSSLEPMTIKDLQDRLKSAEDGDSIPALLQRTLQELVV